MDREGLLTICKLMGEALSKIWPSYTFTVETSLLSRSRRIRIHTTSRIINEDDFDAIEEVRGLVFEVIIHPSRLTHQYIDETFDDVVSRLLEEITLIESVED
tara:strand:+ start:1329 stop:1634 length:306 start_codon:yes stop_codon:yes gene_type:complete